MEKQLELFSLNYAETGNTNQLSPAPGEEPLAAKRNTDGCDFLPAAGLRDYSPATVVINPSNGYYWSSGPHSSNSNNAYNLNFNSNNVNGGTSNNNNRYNGMGIRCVSELTKDTAPAFPVFTITKDQLLVDLFRAYYHARKHKRNTRNQLQFEVNLEENLVQLRDGLFEHTYKVGRSTCFIIADPVKREIFAADFRDRVVHHLIYNYVAPIFERTFIADSYSCRKGKGTLYGVKRLEHHIRSCSQNYTRPCYVMKMDIQGYFMNINRKRLLDIVKEELLRFAPRLSDVKGKRWSEKLDYSLILPLLEEIILTDPTQNCIIKGSKSNWDGLPPNKSLFHTPADCGLPIGNLTSQLFSNIYLNQLDQFVKRELHVAHYGRYVDDYFLVNRNRGALKEHLATIRSFLKEEMGLTLHPKKTVVADVRYGISYLGIFVKRYRRYIDNKTLRRIKQKTNVLHLCTKAELLRASINSYLGYLKHLKCEKIKKQLFEGKEFLKSFGEFNWEFSKFELFHPIPLLPVGEIAGAAE